MKKKDLQSLLALLKEYHSEVGGYETLALIENIQNTRKVTAAGRKPVYSEDVRQLIMRLHDEGSSIRRIAGLTGCSVGYVHKIIHDIQKKGGTRDCTC